MCKSYLHTSSKMWFLQRSAFCVLLFINCVNSQDAYSIPPQKIIVTEKGFRINIPDEPGIQTFFFHGNINKHIEFLDSDAVILSATEPINGKWTVEHNKKGFKPGDFINYWIYIKKDDIGYTSSSMHYQIEDVLPDYPSPVRQSSRRSEKLRTQIVSSTIPRTSSANEIDVIFGSNHLTGFSNKAVPSTTPQPLSLDEMIDIIFVPNGVSQENVVATPKNIPVSTSNAQWAWPNEFTTKVISSTTSEPLSLDELINFVFGTNETLPVNEVTTPKDIPTTTFPDQWVWPN